MNYNSMKSEDVLDEFSVDIHLGLSNKQVIEHRELYGENALPEPETESFIKKLLRQILNPLVLILIGAFLLTLVLHEYVDAFVIFVAVMVNVVVALVQEGKASEAYNLLQKKRVHRAVVLRGGAKEEIDLKEIVKGDLVVLQAGMYVPADIRILEATNLTADQVIFTGESIPVEKTKDPSEAETSFEQTSMIFTGSTVASGSGLGIVTDIAEHTVFAKIATSLLEVEKEKSPIEKESEYIARSLSIVAGVIIVGILLLGLYRDLPFYEIILLAVAVAVSSVPEGLPSAITAILAYGASRIGKRGGLVKNLSSAQTLGSTDVILTDKTGTLTYGHMDVVEIVTRKDEDTDAERRVLEHAILATDVFYDTHHKHFVGDDVDQAIGRYFVEGGEYVNLFLDENPSSYVIPFDSRNKFFAAERIFNNKQTLFAKGAFEVIWKQCSHYLSGNDYEEITDKDYEYYRKIIDEATSRGKRVIAVAHNDNIVDYNSDKPESSLKGAVFCGLLVMEDKVRTSALKSVVEATESGVTVIMITGDAANTARHIAYETAIVDHPEGLVMSGEEMNDYSDEELFNKIYKEDLRVFSRVSPEHKLRLVDLLTAREKTVAMTGDGVNDSLALSRASIGISLSSATDVAKESADLILTDDSFSGIVYALREGRRMAVNISKTIIYLLATSFSEVIVIVGSLFAGLPIPFLPAHILWANILEEGLMNFAFLFEENREPRNKPRDIVDSRVIKLTVFIGILNGLLFLALFSGMYIFTELSAEMKRTIMFGALAVDSLFLAVAMRDVGAPFWRTPFFQNRFFVFAFGLNIVLFGLTIGTEIGRSLLKLEPMTLMQLGLIVCFGIFNLLIVEAGKKVLYKS